ncbi:MAG: hypothetical protein ABIO82_01345, partial [Ginsengibacter sp.]
MSLDTQTFRKRALTAIVFAVVMLVGLLWNAASFILLFTIIHFGCWYEFVKLVKKIKPLTWYYLLPSGILYITLPILLMVSFGFPNLNSSVQQSGANNWVYSPWLP